MHAGGAPPGGHLGEPGQPLYYLPPYRQAFRRALDADMFICLVEAARQHLLEHGVDDERISVVVPGVDTSTFRPPSLR